jgi:hypothetical protein
MNGSSVIFSENDILLGVGPGTTKDTYRLYVDSSVIPSTADVDARLTVKGSMCNYCKVFKGSLIGDTGNVLSKIYDNTGNFISENVPLELVQIDSHINYSTKRPITFNVTEELRDAELVTAVFYADDGHVVSKAQLLVENTSFIRDIDASRKYITHISCDCAFMSDTNDSLIEYPINIPMNALNLMGTVWYSDGSHATLPVNGTKFTMLGLEQHLSSIIGQKVPLTLRYVLDASETSYAGVGVERNYVTEPYNLITVNPNNSYTTKLFGYPVWVDSYSGYRMRWWLLNQDRNVYFEVTGQVRFDDITGGFEPTLYGYVQRKQVSINLREVSGSFKPFVHTQLFEITLNHAPDASSTNWTIANEANVTRPVYGVGLKAVVHGTKINLASGFNTLEEWLENVYYKTYPLVDLTREFYPIVPNEFVINYRGADYRYNINEWDQDLNIGNLIDLHSSLFIRFIKYTGVENLQLAVASMIIV